MGVREIRGSPMVWSRYIALSFRMRICPYCAYIKRRQLSVAEAAILGCHGRVSRTRSHGLGVARDDTVLAPVGMQAPADMTQLRCREALWRGSRKTPHY